VTVHLHRGAAARIAQHRHRERRQPPAVDEAADDVGALVAKENRTQRMHLAVAGDAAADVARQLPAQLADGGARQQAASCPVATSRKSGMSSLH
jgi:hypothetical protein